MSKYLILSDIPRHTVVRFILLFFGKKVTFQWLSARYLSYTKNLKYTNTRRYEEIKQTCTAWCDSRKFYTNTHSTAEKKGVYNEYELKFSTIRNVTHKFVAECAHCSSLMHTYIYTISNALTTWKIPHRDLISFHFGSYGGWMCETKTKTEHNV